MAAQPSGVSARFITSANFLRVHSICLSCVKICLVSQVKNKTTKSEKKNVSLKS